jgi:hypothetical protein
VPSGEAFVISGAPETQQQYDAAYHSLTAAFGEPVAVQGGFRWHVGRPRTGNEVRIDLTPGRASHSDMVWIFDPDARGLSSVFSFDLGTPDGLAWLELEIRRLMRD